MNKFKFIATGTLETPLEKLTCQVRDKLSTYLEKDVDELLAGTDSVIFGGAIRDSIAGFEINDVDILALSKSALTLSGRLKTSEYRQIPTAKIDTTGLYTNVRCIHEPKTYFLPSRKVTEDNPHTFSSPLVQIIRPCIDKKNMDSLATFMWLLHQVDMSCCGVAYSTSRKTVFETYPGAIEHCQNKQFVVLKDNIMHQKDRILHRITKLQDRGWKNITEQTDGSDLLEKIFIQN